MSSFRWRRVAILGVSAAALMIAACHSPDADIPPVRYYAVNMHGKYGLVDSDGRVVVKPQFDALSPIWEGRAAAKIGDRWGYIDETGRLVISPQYSEALEFSHGLAAVRSEDERWGYVDEDGKVVIPPQFDEALEFSDAKRAAVRVGQRWGFIDREGRYVVNPQFDDAWMFAWDNVGLAAVSVSGRWGFVDESGHFAVNPQFDKATVFSEGRAPVKVGERWGYIDRKGTLVISPQFDHASEFHEGLAAVRMGERAGFIDREGTYIINPQFEDATSFFGGRAGATVNGRCGFIDHHGKWLINPQYTSCYPTTGKLMQVRDSSDASGMWRYISDAGKEVARDLPEERPALGAESTDVSPGASSAEPLTMDTIERMSDGTVAVRMIGDEKGYRFSPGVVHIPRNGSVEWRMISGGPHDVAFDPAALPRTAVAQLERDMPEQLAPLQGKMLMSPGDTYRVSFAGVPPGTYRYHCRPHEIMGMQGTLVIDP